MQLRQTKVMPFLNSLNDALQDLKGREIRTIAELHKILLPIVETLLPGAFFLNLEGIITDFKYLKSAKIFDLKVEFKKVSDVGVITNIEFLPIILDKENSERTISDYLKIVELRYLKEQLTAISYSIQELDKRKQEYETEMQNRLEHLFNLF